VWWQEYHSG